MISIIPDERLSKEPDRVYFKLCVLFLNRHVNRRLKIRFEILNTIWKM